MKTPSYRIVKTRLDPPHYKHSIMCGDAEVHSQLSPYGDDEIGQRIREWQMGATAPPHAPAKHVHGGRPGPKPKPPAPMKYDWRTAKESGDGE
jgi:hypothetical protein